jgi:phage terminase large subunit GpA-like protein
MDAINDPAIREIWVMKSAQVGWTEILNNAVGYFIDQDPSPMLLVQPTLEMGEAWSKDRLAPMLRDSPCFVGKVKDARSRDSGNTLLHKQFPGGHITIAGANSPAGLASRPIRNVLLDEVDRFPLSAAAEGDPISLAKKRSTTFWNRKMLAGSTPTVKGRSRIESGFESSDQRYYFVPCSHCGEHQRLVWSQVKWIDDKPETAAYACVHCGVQLLDEDKQQMLAAGEWRSSKPSVGIAGFHISELYSPWVTWSQMVESFLEAKKLPETLQTWINTSLGETWEQAGSTVEPDSLLQRREQYGQDNIPSDVLMLTAGADVQDDRVEVQLIGWGIDEESWIIAQEVFRGDPDKAELWQEVDEYLLRKFSTEDGREMFIEASAIDSGGHNTQAVYQFVVSRKRRRVWAIKGLGGAGKLVWPKKATRTAKSRANVFIVGVDTIKGVLYGRLSKVTEPGPGYIHLPASADAEFCKQLTSEKAATKYVRGRPTLVWAPREKGIRQEVQDCWNYGYAAFIGRRGPDLIKRLSTRIARRSIQRQQPAIDDEQSAHEPMANAAPTRHIENQQQPKQPRPMRPRRSGFVKGWRR